MRWMYIVALSVLACTFACTPDMINHEQKTEVSADAGPDQVTKPDLPTNTCKDDCDCAKFGTACEHGVCDNATTRAGSCPSCADPNCKEGTRCYKADKSVGTCSAAKSCRSDCDCAPSEGVCNGGKCDPTLKRAYVCPDCSGSCTAGQPCKNADGSVGTCGQPKTCKHDCDCDYNVGWVCDSTKGVCSNQFQRASYCVACDGGRCKAGEPCYNADNSIGTCGGTETCKDDCDCVKSGGICENNRCTNARPRPNSCPSCADPNCKAGTRCYNADKSVGSCAGAKTCKDDCDCPSDLACGGGTCQPMGRTNLCPSCSDPACKAGTRCKDSSGTAGTCSGPTSCKDDCDCIKAGGVCEGGSCNTVVTRASNCPSCLNSTCQAGTRCYYPDKTIGTCGSSHTCKEDCDCVPYGLLCDSGTCRALRRVSQCPSCSDPNCKAGTRCEGPNNTVSTCGGAAACKDDCDCIKVGGVCESGSCNTVVKRASLCPSCLNSTCQAGTRCYNPDNTIGTCGSTKTCSEDCDCVPYGLLCDAGTCRALRRLSQCPSCSDPNCKAGTRCEGPNNTVSTCSAPSCKDDCDCVPHGLLCDSGTCRALRRLSQCPLCTDPTCKAGTRCQGPNNTVSTCAGSKTFACGDKQCQAGAEYCSMTVGGAAPSCQSLPPHSGTSCPSYCNSVTGCVDGKLRCSCPSTSCVAMKQGCTDCKCLQTSGQVPAGGPCQCQDKNGNPHVTCYAP